MRIINDTKSFEEKLSETETMQEILNVCSEYYNLNEPLGFGTKIVVTSGIKKVVKVIRAEKIK
tara:strand:- start:4835 stop:5023 length:189 start_codon:yes stop_codon:yes gene_type:complete